MVATSPVRHEPPPSVQLAPIEVHQCPATSAASVHQCPGTSGTSEASVHQCPATSAASVHQCPEVSGTSVHQCPGAGAGAPPWKALSDFALQSDLEQAPFQQLVSSFQSAAPGVPTSSGSSKSDQCLEHALFQQLVSSFGELGATVASRSSGPSESHRCF